MESKQIKNKEGTVLTDKEGKELVENRFQPGDEFIPRYNSVLERKNTCQVKGQEKTITNYSIKCDVQEKDGTRHADVFVALTPSQAKSLKKKIEGGIELNQNLFVAYSYEHEEHGTCIGVGLKSDRKKAKTFEDFESDRTD